MEPDWHVAVEKGWELVNDEPKLIQYFMTLKNQNPESSRAHFELANALDFCGREAEAIPHYEEALRFDGLSHEVQAYTMVQLGSSLRNVGRVEEAIDLLVKAEHDYPEHWAVSLFLALALYSAGRPADALKTAMRATLKHGRAEDLTRYRGVLTNYIDDIT